ncbi:MAG: phosphate acetyltransferase [Syntrophobacteraceae bacterium]
MSRGLYITGTGPGSGKSVVILGVMELLAARSGNIGFFRPVAYPDAEQDHCIQLISKVQKLKLPRETFCGCTYVEAARVIRGGRITALPAQILEKYKALEDQCDFVLCAGTDYTGVNTALEFDFNVNIARNLGIPLLPVISSFARTPAEIVDSVKVLAESLEAKNCDLFAVVANHVDERWKEETAAKLRNEVKESVRAYAVPQHSLLEKPSVAEVARALHAEIVSGEPEGLEREIHRYKIGAMGLPSFLEELAEGSLVFASADRSDIILGALLADASATYPQVAGLVLTEGIKLEPQVQRLLAGLRKSSVPLLSVAQDTFATATAVSSLRGKIGPENKRKIAVAQSLFESNVDLPYIGERLMISRSSRITPLMFEYELISRAKKNRQHIVLPEGSEERVLRAAEILLLRGVVEITLLGSIPEIQDKLAKLGLSLPGVNIIDPASSDLRHEFAETYYQLRKHKGISKEMAFDLMADVSYFGTMMIHHGNADGMVSGAVHTTQHTIRPALEIIRTIPGCAIVSSAFLMCLPDRVLVYGDCAVNPDPNSRQLADIAICAASTSEMFGIEPRVAMLSYSTGESGKGADVEKVREATRIARELRPDLKIEGPIQYDAAIDPDVAKVKMPLSEVAGRATVFVFPDLNTGNNTYKAVQRSASAVAIGPVLQGLNKPVNDLSRGCTVTDIVNTVAITAIQAQAGKGSHESRSHQ